MCQMCLERGGKTWAGSDPTCAFEDGASFSRDNWNCATVNAIRDICYEGQRQLQRGVDYQYCDDQKYATINIHDILTDDETINLGDALWVSWYKNRGRTDEMWMLGGGDPPRLPTEQDCRIIIRKYYKNAPPHTEGG